MGMTGLSVCSGALSEYRFGGHAAGEAHAMALGTLYRTLEQQATFMASLDGFTAMAVVALAAGIFAAWQRTID